jgi:tetratricopeptide (TPR) repeat protein
MRHRRWRRLVDEDRDLQRTTAEPTGGRALKWLSRHILVTIIGGALIAVLVGWFSGFFGAILAVVPSGAEAFCDLRETIDYHWPFAAPLANSDRFTILIATIDHDDADHTYTRAVERAFFKKDGIDRIETCRVLRLGVGRDAEITTGTTARKWLEQRHADLLIGGEMLKKEDAISLWFIDKEPTHDWRPSTFRLDANLLRQDFGDAASSQLLAVALSAIRPAVEDKGRYLVRLLKPVAERLRHLLEPSTGFTAIQSAELQQALGFASLVIGEQSGDKNALADAAKAFRATLAVWTREREPFRWAATENNLGDVLVALGERESGESSITHLQQAVSAYDDALGEPQLWALVKNNLAGALIRLGERESGESSIARFQDAVAACHDALKELTRERVPAQWATVQNNLGAALGMLGERESGDGGIAHLREAVITLRASLEEQPRARVPLGWAQTEGNLASALAWLGERESGESSIAHLREAFAADAAALSVFFAEGAMYHVNRSLQNIARTAALLAARLRAQRHGEP